ncbi:MAG: spore coat protein [Ruminiclostridium sp.]|nr:spore coat protein [Ruminiclostridium sp.]
MNDKNLMENLLLLEKGVCDLYVHGALESGTQKVHQTFQTALNTSLSMQDELYSQMTAKGWYQQQNVQQQKIQDLKQKFSGQ